MVESFLRVAVGGVTTLGHIGNGASRRGPVWRRSTVTGRWSRLNGLERWQGIVLSGRRRALLPASRRSWRLSRRRVREHGAATVERLCLSSAARGKPAPRSAQGLLALHQLFPRGLPREPGTGARMTFCADLVRRPTGWRAIKRPVPATLISRLSGIQLRHELNTRQWSISDFFLRELAVPPLHRVLHWWIQ